MNSPIMYANTSKFSKLLFKDNNNCNGNNNNNISRVLHDLPEAKWTSERQIKKHLSFPPVLMQRRDTLGERTSEKGLSTEQNTDTHRTRKLMAGMVLKCKYEVTCYIITINLHICYS